MSKILSLAIMIFILSSFQTIEETIIVGQNPREFSIIDAKSSYYNVKLQKDKFYSFQINQKGVDVQVYLENNQNRVLIQKDSPNGSNGLEQFYFYCENDGDYKLRIEPFSDKDSSASGKYTIEVIEESTETEIVLEKSQYLKDFKAFREIFESANSGLYRYRSQKEIEKIFELNQTKITDKTTYREFYNLIWNVIDYTGSCHNNLKFPESLNILLNRKKIFFPIPLKYIEGKLYTNGIANEAPSGSEIVSINGIKSVEFAKQISKYKSTDGFNQTAKHNFIETDWMPTFVYNAFGEQSEFLLEFKNNISTTVKAVDYSTFINNFNKRFSRELEDQNNIDYKYQYIDSLETGILSIKSFDFGEKGDESYSKYQSFLDSAFNSLKSVKNLIVDIRGNGGGSGDALMLLTTYLTTRNVKENLQAYTLFNKIPFPEYYIGSRQDQEEFLADYTSDFNNGKYFQNQKYNPVWISNKNAFIGSFILLVDPFVASAASHFAAHIKSDQQAIVIGQETGGGYYGHTGHIPISYELPNSKLILSFSIVNLEQDVVRLQDQEFSQGVMPDFTVVQTYLDYKNNVDTQLKFAFRKIANQKKKKKQLSKNR